MKVACAIICAHQKILITQRPLHKSQGGKWEFPGGKLHENETPSDCIVREIMEELAVEVEVIKELTSIIHAYPTFTIELVPLLCSMSNNKIILREHISSKWCGFEDLLLADLSDADRNLLPQLEALLR